MSVLSKMDMIKLLEGSLGKDEGPFCFLEAGHGAVQVPMSVRSVSVPKNELALWADDEAFQLIRGHISGSGKLSFYDPSRGVHFQAMLLCTTEGGLLRFRLPESGKFFERRSQERRDLKGPMEMRFEHKGRPYRKLCFDVHEGGMSIVFPKSEAAGLKAGTVIPVLRATLGKCSEETIAEVVSVSKISPKASEGAYYSGVRVSFRFKSPPERFTRLISIIRAQAFAH